MEDSGLGLIIGVGVGAIIGIFFTLATADIHTNYENLKQPQIIVIDNQVYKLSLEAVKCWNE